MLLCRPSRHSPVKKILDEGKFLVVENHEVQTPAGHIIPNWSWVITPDYINVIAVTEDKKFLLFRQTKYAFDGQLSLAPVGGYLEPNEEPLAAAKRELREEMGYEAKEGSTSAHIAWTPIAARATARSFSRSTLITLAARSQMILNRKSC